MQPRYILRFADTGAAATSSTYARTDAGRAEASRAARRIAKRTGRTVEVWWCNDAGVSKVMAQRVVITRHDGAEG